LLYELKSRLTQNIFIDLDKNLLQGIPHSGHLPGYLLYFDFLKYEESGKESGKGDIFGEL
jgi:hypothetical protein